MDLTDWPLPRWRLRRTHTLFLSKAFKALEEACVYGERLAPPLAHNSLRSGWGLKLPGWICGECLLRWLPLYCGICHRFLVVMKRSLWLLTSQWEHRDGCSPCYIYGYSRCYSTPIENIIMAFVLGGGNEVCMSMFSETQLSYSLKTSNRGPVRFKS